jgi:lysophospholipase L1-like esterase
VTIPGGAYGQAGGSSAVLPAGITGTGTLLRPSALYQHGAQDLEATKTKLSAVAAGVGALRIGCMGASITDGYTAPASVRGATDYPTQLRQLFAAAGYPVGDFSGFGVMAASQTDTRVTSTGTYQNSTLQGSCFWYLNAVNSTVTYTSPVAGTVVEVDYYDAVGVTFTISVDGAGSGAGYLAVATGGTLTNRRVTLPGLASAAHVVKATQTGAAAVFIWGIGCYPLNAVTVANFGIGGSATVYNAAQPNRAAWSLAALAYQPLNVAVNFQADLYINDLCGINDYGSVTDAALEAGTYNIGAYLKLLGNSTDPAGPDILLLNERVQAYAIPASFRQDLYTAADMIPAALLDMWDLWGPADGGARALALGLIGTDGLHPSTTGYRAMARAVLAALSN